MRRASSRVSTGGDLAIPRRRQLGDGFCAGWIILLDYLDVPARIAFHGLPGIAVPAHDAVIALDADDGASAVRLEVTAPAQHRDAFVAQHTALAYYRTIHRGNPVIFWFVPSMRRGAASVSPQHLRQLGEVHGNPVRLVSGALPAPRFRRAAAIDSAVSTLTPKKVSQ